MKKFNEFIRENQEKKPLLDSSGNPIEKDEKSQVKDTAGDKGNPVNKNDKDLGKEDQELVKNIFNKSSEVVNMLKNIKDGLKKSI